MNKSKNFECITDNGGSFHVLMFMFNVHMRIITIISDDFKTIRDLISKPTVPDDEKKNRTRFEFVFFFVEKLKNAYSGTHVLVHCSSISIHHGTGAATFFLRLCFSKLSGLFWISVHLAQIITTTNEHDYLLNSNMNKWKSARFLFLFLVAFSFCHKPRKKKRKKKENRRKENDVSHQVRGKKVICFQLEIERTDKRKLKKKKTKIP